MGSGRPEDCSPCPEGSFCREGSAKPSPCPASTFRRQKGGKQAEDCSLCPAGYSCPHLATVQPHSCGAGSYSDQGSAACSPCLPGHYCSHETTSREAMLSTMVCPAGLICSAGLDREPQRAAILCPKGFYCPGGSIDPNPRPCPNGTYSDQPGLRDLSDCSPCPEGKYCYSDQQPHIHGLSQPTGQCPDGYYCPVGTGYPYSFPCPPGLYRNSSHGHGGGDCVPCAPGHYCAQAATHAPAVCPKGFFCIEGSSTPEPCEEGTYSPRLALRQGSECTPCGGGRYCTGVAQTEPTGLCKEGFYCKERARSATPADGQTGGLCPVGSFCPAGSAAPSPCPTGTFSNSTGLQSPGQCAVCPPGTHCSGSNNTSPAGPCAPGYFCTGGSSSSYQHEAQEGHYTLLGAVRAEPCPLGTFQPDRAQSTCLPCLQGHFCNQTGAVQPTQCPPGHYCPPGAVLPSSCPVGSYSAQGGAEDVGHCSPCDPGMFCGSSGLSAPQGVCAPGFYCAGGATTATPVAVSSGDVCPAGYYCPLGSRHPRAHPCPPGTWSNAVGAHNESSCWPCPAGFFCNGTGLRQATGLCAPGFYCLRGATSPMPLDGVTGDKCPPGYHCPQGTAVPQPCQDGTFSNTTGSAECLECPPGFYCLLDQGVQMCPEGHYCPGGTGMDVLPCPPGTYSAAPGHSQLEQCLLCPAGMYCEEWGLAHPTGP
uniref:Tyrosine-protein kinase ephrin type A/B receptor-like domain-containing protein n=1 Tax=Lepisosteus oculatus TaxID=7918 RepID=W5M2P7_LEPOC